MQEQAQLREQEEEQLRVQEQEQRRTQAENPPIEVTKEEETEESADSEPDLGDGGNN